MGEKNYNSPKICIFIQNGRNIKRAATFRHGSTIIRIQRTHAMCPYIIYAPDAQTIPPQAHHPDKQDTHRMALSA